MIRKILLFFIATLLFTSCVSREKLVYYQNLPSFEDAQQNFETKIKADDLLMIVVSAPNDAAKDFNLPITGVTGTTTFSNGIDVAAAQQRVQAYTVNKNGEVQLPVLGTVKISGLTKEEALRMLNEKLSAYLKEFTINLRIVNFKVTVAGEVTKPGIVTLQTERLTLPEAIAMAGDMSIYGKRDNVLVMREIDGVKTYNYIDMTKADFINSPFYYLSQNDYVYVEPNKTRINSSAVGPNVSVLISATSILISLIAILTR